MTFSFDYSHKSTKLLSCENVQLSVGRLQMVCAEDTLKRLPCSSYLNERLEIAKHCTAFPCEASHPHVMSTLTQHWWNLASLPLTLCMVRRQRLLFVSLSHSFLTMVNKSTSYDHNQSVILKFRTVNTNALSIKLMTKGFFSKDSFQNIVLLSCLVYVYAFSLLDIWSTN